MTDHPYIDRVRAADAEAEARWAVATKSAEKEGDFAWAQADALIAIAAELRAQRIARRTGAGQS